MNYYIKTFGCQQNEADSERIDASFRARGYNPSRSMYDADYVIINTCMVRESAENRVYGLVNNLGKHKSERQANGSDLKIIVTGCMVGVAFRDPSGKYFDRLRTIMPEVDEFLPIEEVGFDMEPVRKKNGHALVPISNGCNNFCTFCIVPFTRGREISRPYNDILAECRKLANEGYKSVMLLGQNVNSYGADLIMGRDNIQVMRDLNKPYFETDEALGKETDDTSRFVIEGRKLKPIYVKHLGRQRIPTLFPYLLEDIAGMGFEHVEFVSSNPWDVSPELIEVIARNDNISRTIHLPVQSGDTQLLKKMNRWYTREEYLDLITTMKRQIPGVRFTTDIIVGFCGETDEQFDNTYDLCKQVGFTKAYIAMYSERPMTAATKVLDDTVPHPVKKDRWEKLNNLINKAS